MSAVQHIQDYLPKQKTLPASTISPETGKYATTETKKNRIDFLFENFTRLYHEKFADRLATDELYQATYELWQAGTADLSNEQMRFALNETAKRCAWPPSLAEFRAFAESMPKPQVFYTALPRKTTSEQMESAKKAIRHLKFLTGTLN